MIEAENKFRESVKDFIFEVFKGSLTTQLKAIFSIILAIIEGESISTSDIVDKYQGCSTKME